MERNRTVIRLAVLAFATFAGLVVLGVATFAGAIPALAAQQPGKQHPPHTHRAGSRRGRARSAAGTPNAPSGEAMPVGNPR
jgi:hypothetical protein